MESEIPDRPHKTNLIFVKVVFPDGPVASLQKHEPRRNARRAPNGVPRAKRRTFPSFDIKGGKGQFGVVTEMIFRNRSTRLLKIWFEACPSLPREAFSAFVRNGTILTVLPTTTGQAHHLGLQQFLKAMEGVTGKSTSAKSVPLSAAPPPLLWRDGPRRFQKRCPRLLSVLKFRA